MKSFLKRFFLILFIVILLVVAYLIYLDKQADIISKGEIISDYDTVKSVLMVIDIQEATTGKVSITEEYIQQSDMLITKINHLIQHSEKKDIPVIYIYTETDNWLINLLNSTMKKGSIGTELDSRLHQVSEHILPKEKKDSFSNPYLDKILREKEVSRLYIVGLDAAYCVKNTIIAAVSRGYKVIVIEDALISETQALKDEMINLFLQTGVKIISSNDYLEN